MGRIGDIIWSWYIFEFVLLIIHACRKYWNNTAWCKKYEKPPVNNLFWRKWLKEITNVFDLYSLWKEIWRWIEWIACLSIAGSRLPGTWGPWFLRKLRVRILLWWGLGLWLYRIYPLWQVFEEPQGHPEDVERIFPLMREIWSLDKKALSLLFIADHENTMTT